MMAADCWFVSAFDWFPQVQELYNFVDCLENLSCMDYTLVIGFPRSFLGEDKLHMNLEMVGLVPGGLVMVQSNDD